MSKIVYQGLRYFFVVFSAGFGLGIVRTIWLVPAMGERWAELTEMPVMLGVIVLVARGLVQPNGNTTELPLGSAMAYLGVGVVAMMCILVADLGVGVGLRGMTIFQALFERDPISGTVYYVLLLILAIMPWLWVKRVQR